MSKIPISRSISYQGFFLGNPIRISIEIEDYFKAVIHFTLQGRPYSFVIDSWQGRGFSEFIGHFYNINTSRNVAKFGVTIDKEDGTREYFKSLGPQSRVMTQDQKLNIIQQGCEDIMACLNSIGIEHQRSVLEYCIWYHENHVKDTYDSYITMTTSLAVIQSHFMAPGITWQLVEFSTEPSFLDWI